MTDRSTNTGQNAFSFGPFHFVPAQQLLLEGEVPVRLGSRALAILTALVERPGKLVSKGELMARVWPDTTVEENNLKVHVAGVRRALGEGQAGRRYIATIPGRGYCFVAPIESSQPRAISSATAKPAHNLPASSIRAIGRVDTLNTLLKQLPQRRFISVVGPAGIGKTTVALAAAEALIFEYRHGVWFVDLAPLREADFVPNAVASALGLTVHSINSVSGLLAYLRDKQMLIVLDNCEHVIEAAAAVAEQIVGGAPGVQILTTSRESLGAKGEHLHRLSSLGSPVDSSLLTAAAALAFPAVQLFVERAKASSEDFELSDSDASIVGDICRKLDGIPLAIELMAARSDIFGVHELSKLLDDRIRLLRQETRTSVARHRSLAAALDWSYELLPPDERVILARLSVFVGSFSLESACVVAGESARGIDDVIEGVASLVAKSLISADVGGAVVQYRLLDTTRAYALQKLATSGEADMIVRRHAEHHRDLLARSAAESETRSSSDWLPDYGRKIDDVRSALNWAFSAKGDLSVGVALTISAIPLWMRLSLMDECRACIDRALASDFAETQIGDRDRMRLYAALGAALLMTRGAKPELAVAWTKTLQIAERVGDNEHRLRALWGLSTYHRTHGDHRTAVVFAQKCHAAAGDVGDTAAQLAAGRLNAAALYHLANYDTAQQLCERFLSQYIPSTRPTHNARFPYDQRVAALGTLANILWLRGFPDQAARMAQTALEEAQAKLTGLFLCDIILNTPLPISLRNGDRATAGRLLVLLRENLKNHALGFHTAKALSYEAIIRIRQGDADGLPLLRKTLDDLREVEFFIRYPAQLGVLARALAAHGQVAQARDVIAQALEMCERQEEHWCLPELLRMKGEILGSEEHYHEALDIARRQGALAWELRIATNMARLWHKRAEASAAHKLLSSVYSRFTEGFETKDLKTAKSILDEIG